VPKFIVRKEEVRKMREEEVEDLLKGEGL